MSMIRVRTLQYILEGCVFVIAFVNITTTNTVNVDE